MRLRVNTADTLHWCILPPTSVSPHLEHVFAKHTTHSPDTSAPLHPRRVQNPSETAPAVPPPSSTAIIFADITAVSLFAVTNSRFTSSRSSCTCSISRLSVSLSSRNTRLKPYQRISGRSAGSTDCAICVATPRLEPRTRFNASVDSADATNAPGHIVPHPSQCGNACGARITAFSTTFESSDSEHAGHAVLTIVQCLAVRACALLVHR